MTGSGTGGKSWLGQRGVLRQAPLPCRHFHVDRKWHVVAMHMQRGQQTRTGHIVHRQCLRPRCSSPRVFSSRPPTAAGNHGWGCEVLKWALGGSPAGNRLPSHACGSTWSEKWHAVDMHASRSADIYIYIYMYVCIYIYIFIFTYV